MVCLCIGFCLLRKASGGNWEEVEMKENVVFCFCTHLSDTAVKC